MASLIVRPPWSRSDREATPESVYWDRRTFVKRLGLGVAALGAGACGPGASGGREAEARDTLRPRPREAPRPTDPLDTIPPTPTSDLYPAMRNRAYSVEGAPTDRIVAATHNNFYEFTTDKAAVWEETGPFEARPWTLEVAGEAERTGVWDVAELERRFGLEERLYRFRCVEAWAMDVPWTGFPLRRLIEWVQPLSSARYVRFVSFLRPEQAIGQRTQTWYPWPYYEGLRMDEAMNELTLAVTGVYGAPLPKQHGAPLRIIVPWKYGYKSPKSIVKMEFVRERPPIFWNDLEPDEYGFFSNVNPEVPHPRWSQATEELIGTGRRRPTLLLNGYGDQVEDLYDPALLRRRS